MSPETIVSVTSERQLELPPEVKAKLRPGDEYSISVTEDAIVFKKVKPEVDLDEFFRKQEQLPPDPEQLSMEEICEIVKEVRREMGSK